MDAAQIFTCLLVVVTIGFFVWEKISPDVVSMSVLFLLMVVPFNGAPILFPNDSKEQSLILGKIFANNAILTVVFMFIVGAAVEQTGLVDRLGSAFHKIGGKGDSRILLMLALLAVPVSAFLNNTTVVVVLLPMVLGLCRQRSLAPSRYLIPLSYFAIVGGMLTTIGSSTNLLANGAMRDKGLVPFGMFEFTGAGLVLAVVAFLYLQFFGRKLLPERTSLAALINSEDGREFLTAAIVSEASPLVGKRLPETPLAKRRNLRVIEIRRSGNRVNEPLNAVIFEPGDRLIMKTHVSSLVGLSEIEGIQMAAKSELGLAYVQTEKAVLMEGMIGPKSSLAHKSLTELNFRQQFGVIILAVHRHGENLRSNFENVKLEFGDTLLLEGSAERMQELFNQRDFINLSSAKSQTQRTGRAWIAILALVWIVVMGCLDNVMPFQWVALTAALMVTLGGCLTTEEVYTAVDWKIIVMLIGTIGLGVALERTGASSRIALALKDSIGGLPPQFVFSLVFLFAILMTELLSNNAVATLFTPLAIEMARQLGLSERPFAAAILFGASIGFALPSGYQTHMLVYGAGGYRFSDFLRIGIPLDILLWIVGSLTIPLFFPL